MKQLFSLLILFLAIFTSRGQFDSGFTLKDNTNFSLDAGTAFTAGSGYSGNSLFIRPTLTKSMSRNFSLHAGTMFQSYQLFTQKNSELNTYFPAYSLSFFGMGSVDLNEKITLYGGYMYSKPFTGKSGNEYFSPGNTFFGGIDYRVSNSSTLGIRVAYSKNEYSLFNYPSMFRNGPSGYFPDNGFLFGY